LLESNFKRRWFCFFFYQHLKTTRKPQKSFKHKKQSSAGGDTFCKFVLLLTSYWQSKCFLKSSKISISWPPTSTENVIILKGMKKAAFCSGLFCGTVHANMWCWLVPVFAIIGLTTPQQQSRSSDQNCEFPQSWQGTWYHLGFPQPLNISFNHISSKGTCVQQSGSMFIITDRWVQFDHTRELVFITLMCCSSTEACL
jgi:hypothetical protein